MTELKCKCGHSWDGRSGDSCLHCGRIVLSEVALTDAVSAYPELSERVQSLLWEKLEMNSQYGKEHRTARLPRFGGRHGQRCKGSIQWDAEARGWFVVFPLLVGFETTARKADWYRSWHTAMNQYREHDRNVRLKAVEVDRMFHV